jgi:S1-C subfamily serine protease
MSNPKRQSLRVSASLMRDLCSAKRKLSERFLHPTNMPIAPSTAPEENVVGVGVGEKITGGKRTGKAAVKIFVRFKFPESHLPSVHKLPAIINGLPTDVEEVGEFKKVKTKPRIISTPNPRLKYRPAQPGSSIGFADPSNQFVMAGTFGAVVTDDSGKFYVLSNNHVLANENALPLGSPIFQPGLLDGGEVATDQVASLTRFVTLQTSEPNTVDCAIAEALQSSLVDPDILQIGLPKGTATAALNMTVEKFGRTSAYTSGLVSSIDTDVKVGYDLGTLIFQGQILITNQGGKPFSAAGDSGVVDSRAEFTTSGRLALRRIGIAHDCESHRCGANIAERATLLMATEQQITNLKNRHYQRLLSQKGVSGVGVEKDKSGGYVLVVHLDDPQVPIPDQIEGLPVKRVVGGAFRKFN